MSMSLLSAVKQLSQLLTPTPSVAPTGRTKGLCVSSFIHCGATCTAVVHPHQGEIWPAAHAGDIALTVFD